MRDWKTTTCGVITALFGFVLFAPDYFTALPWLVDLAKYGAAGGLAAMGFAASDYRKKPQVDREVPSPPETQRPWQYPKL